MANKTISIQVEKGVAVSGILHEPRVASGTGIVLGHGAGADMTSALVVAAADGLAERGHATLRFNFPYRELGKKVPDPPAKLQRAFRAAALALRATGMKKLVIGGKSLGGRVASLCAAHGLPCDGLFFLGYPLHPAKQPEKLRDAHLPAVTAPMLFVQGTRDALCDLDLLRPVLARLGARASLYIVEGGDHSLDLLKSAGRTRESVYAEVIGVMGDWIDAGFSIGPRGT
jgi:uncharacterized protein